MPSGLLWFLISDSTSGGCLLTFVHTPKTVSSSRNDYLWSSWLCWSHLFWEDNQIQAGDIFWWETTWESQKPSTYARELWSNSWHIVDHRNLMTGKTSSGPILTAELIDGAVTQPYWHTYFCLPAVMSWGSVWGIWEACQSTHRTVTEENVKWGMSVW